MPQEAGGVAVWTHELHVASFTQAWAWLQQEASRHALHVGSLLMSPQLVPPLLDELLLEELEPPQSAAHSLVQAVWQTQATNALYWLMAVWPAWPSQVVAQLWLEQLPRHWLSVRQLWSPAQAWAWLAQAPISELDTHVWQLACALPAWVPPTGSSAR
jgi:hypothetical protein